MKTITVLTAALLAAAVAVPARAVTLQYVLTGTDVDGSVEFAKFRLDDKPAILPNNVGLGGGFRVKFIPGIFQYGATVFTLRDVLFYSDANFGGFIDSDPADKVGGSSILVTQGPQLYSGSEATPTLLTGTFELFDSYSGAPLSLKVTAVPEPASWGLMLAGFAATGVVLRRRQRAAGGAGRDATTAAIAARTAGRRLA